MYLFNEGCSLSLEANVEGYDAEGLNDHLVDLFVRFHVVLDREHVVQIRRKVICLTHVRSKLLEKCKHALVNRQVVVALL